jgi:hypothetical protein
MDMVAMDCTEVTTRSRWGACKALKNKETKKNKNPFKKKMTAKMKNSEQSVRE